MANMPAPAPPLDGVPPSPPGFGPSQQNPPISQLAPQAQQGGDLQTVQTGLQIVAQAAQLLDMAGQIFPAFSSTAQMLISQMKAGFKVALQQGSAQSEPSLGNMTQGMTAMQGQATPGPTQQPLPPLPSA